MAFDLQRFADERQLPATPRRRQEARRRGQVPRSAELGPALGLVVATGVLAAVGPAQARTMAAWSASLWGSPLAGDLTLSGVMALGASALTVAAGAAAPVILAATAVSVGATAAQVGFSFSLEPLQPRLERLNPLEGLGRIFSTRGLVELARAVLKLGIVVGVSWGPLSTLAQALPSLGGELGSAAAGIWSASEQVLLRTGVALLAMAGGDLFYQRWEYDRQLRMSREDVREEMRETEGDPALRSRRRRRQRELSRRRMLLDVARADAVVTNPTHYAVALRYRAEEAAAPVVLAKGRDWMAERIKAIARAHDIVILENPPLAQSLYRTARVGQVIPAALYQAVAEILAFVWRLQGRA